MLYLRLYLFTLEKSGYLLHLNSMFALHTPRLKLIPLDLTCLHLLQQDRTLMEKHLGLTPSNLALSDDSYKNAEDALEFWLVKVSENKADYHWFTNWEIVLKDKNCSMGGIGFAGAPDEKGEVTMGYGLDNRYHNQGYATESVKALVDWAFEQPATRKIIAETQLDNEASKKVLIKNGFRFVAPRDGLFVWELGKS